MRPLAFAVLLSLLPGVALADLSPKPAIDFSLRAAPEAAIAEGVLLECESAKCAKPRPMGQFGPQTFGCGSKSCSGRAYGFPAYLELSLTFADGRHLVSTPFAKSRFNEKFDVMVADGRLKVTPAP